jgi:predicted transcriptional regulator
MEAYRFEGGAMSEQLSIEFVSRRARRSDPETSKKAAEKAERFATSHAGRILAALKTHGPRTAHELSQLIGLTVVQIDRRTIELQRAGHIDVAKLDDGADRVVDGFRVWMAK